MSAPGQRKSNIEKAPQKPVPLTVNPAPIPASIKKLDQWVCWRYERPKDKWTKPLLNPKTGKMAKSTDPSTWGTFEQAWKLCQDLHFDGIGFVLAAPYAGIDLDDARDPETGNVSDWALEIVRNINSYTEISPSGTGVKIFLKGRKPGNKCRISYGGGEVEVYDSGRYFAVTGHHLCETPATIEDRQRAFEQLYRDLWPDMKPSSSATRSHPDLSDNQIIEKARAAKNGDKFRRLLAGGTEDYGGDHSRADLAFCDMIAFWTGPDASAIDRVFRASGMFRPKWDERRGGRTYGQITIERALQNRTEFYRPGPPPSLNGQSDGPEIHLTDLGNARRVVHDHGKDVRFCHPWKRWFVWDGRHWLEDETAEVIRRIKDTQKNLYRMTAEKILILGEVGDDEARKQALAKLDRLLRHALKWEDDKRIVACLNQMKSEPTIPILPVQLDSDPFLLNCLNGTLDLRTGQLRTHRREDYQAKLAPVDYQPDAECPLWLRFLHRIMDGKEDLIEYLRCVVGYALTGDVSEQALWFLYGLGMNGKTVFLLTLLNLFGDYALQAVSELLLVKSHESHPTERADLCGRRLVATIETDEGKRMAEALMKQLTGSDRIRARKMRQDFFEFQPTHKIFLAANHKPTIRGTDLAVWRRIKLIPFTVTIPKEERDKKLLEKLKAELPGILAWAVRGCLDWQQHGLVEPEIVRQATDAYRAEQDLLSGFITERCFVHTTVKAQASKMFDAYQEWTGDKTTTQKAFTSWMEAKGYPSVPGTGNRRFYEGIGLLD